jgi:basic amino acid/polyamine antiporter, APA family
MTLARSSLFAKKPVSLLLQEAGGRHGLRPVLGALQLTGLGVGAIVGAGIFVIIGVVAKDKAGAATMLSFVVAGSACAFAALCYAEFASMVPVAGSAYTYAYATLGELFAWIIGWDLLLEYGVGAASVAHGWSHYFVDFLGLLGFNLPAALTNSPFDFNPATGAFVATGAIIDLPALLIAALLTAILVTGIRQSAVFNFFMVVIKLAVVLLILAIGVFYIDARNWRPFAPYGFAGVSLFGKTLLGQHGPGGEPLGMLAGAAIVFYAYIGFDSVSTHAEEARQPRRDVPIGIIASLTLCTVLYIAVAAVLTGMVPYQQIDIDAPVAKAFS